MILLKIVSLFVAVSLLFTCGSLRKAPEFYLPEDYYILKDSNKLRNKVYAKSVEDSILISPYLDFSKSSLLQNQHFIKKSIDVDILTFPFKFRGESKDYFPRQLTTDFNGNVFIGYRTDRYTVKRERNPFGLKKTVEHRALTVGAFSGIGTTFISPWTTNYKITDEYNGFILSRGISAMIAVNNLTIGLGIGWDYLTDRDKYIWIYQDQLWYGLGISLNIN